MVIAKTTSRPTRSALHRREIEQLDQAAVKQGMTLVATRIYLKNRRIKLKSQSPAERSCTTSAETELRRTVDRETGPSLKSVIDNGSEEPVGVVINNAN